MENDIVQLVITFRKAIDKPKEDQAFYDDWLFNRFPTGCCGLAS